MVVSKKSVTVLGIDPGSRVTGYAVLQTAGSQQNVLASGQIATRGEDLGQRLHQIHQGITEIVQTHQPQELAIEQVFVAHNVQSALKLGQARGAAIVACAAYALDCFEYSPREVKQAVVGYGAASKGQVQHMMRAILKLTRPLKADEADALAIAWCHCQMRTLKLRLMDISK